MESILITARIKQGHYQDILDIIAEGPPFDLHETQITHHRVFIHPGSLSFLFEGPPGLRKVVRKLVTDSSVINQMQRIAEFIEGTPQESDTVFTWDVDSQDSARRIG